MAPGYVIAALLEAAGLIGLLLAALVLRAERRARAAELRSFLRSGQSALAAPGPAAPSRRAAPAPRVIAVPVALGRPGGAPARDTTARSALRRAVMRGGDGRTADFAGSFSAG